MKLILKKSTKMNKQSFKSRTKRNNQKPKRSLGKGLGLLLVMLMAQLASPNPIIRLRDAYKVNHDDQRNIISEDPVTDLPSISMRNGGHRALAVDAELNQLKIVANIKPLQGLRTDSRAGDGEALYDLLVNKMLSSVIKLLEKSVKVYAPLKMDLRGITSCYGSDMSHLSKVVDGNLAVTFDYEYDSGQRYVAYATHCYHTAQKRPIVGYVMLNLA